MRKPTFSHRLEHIALVGASTIIVALPERWAFAFGSALGWLGGSILRIRRNVVDENLERAFPDKSPDWRRRVAAASYRHLGREGVALLRMERMDPEEIQDRCRIEGLEWIRDALNQGRGVMILTGHLGNWEIGGAAVACAGVPLDVVAKIQANPLFDDRLRRTRRRLAMEVIDRDAASTRRVLRSLRGTRAVALVADQNVREGGIFVDFFGFPASTTRGPGLLAARTGAAVVVALVRCFPGEHVRYRLRIQPMPVEVTHDAADDLTRFTRDYTQCLETGIREAPDQYFWFHRRWKTRPELRERGAGDAVSGEVMTDEVDGSA